MIKAKEITNMKKSSPLFGILLALQLVILPTLFGASKAWSLEYDLCDCAGESQQVLLFPNSGSESRDGADIKDGGGSDLTFPTDWEGIYDGGSKNLVIRRSIEMHLSHTINEAGGSDVSGTMTIKPYVGDFNSVYEGSYKFNGTYDQTTKKIVIQGYTWISYPIDRQGGQAPEWDFFVFTGTVGAEKITGTTPRGEWKMVPQSFDGDDIDSGFQLGRDNNNFVHSNYSYGGFYGTTNYVISTTLFNRLKQFTSSESEVNALKKEMYEEWWGSCYGISLTMGLVFRKLLTASEISGQTLSKNDYFHMPQPKESKQLKDIINYYHLSQNIETYGEVAGRYKNYNSSLWSGWINDKNAKIPNVSLSGFLSNLLKDAQKACKEGSVLLFCYSSMYSGHLILVTGYSVSEDGYRLKLYDMNTVHEYGQNGNFLYMNISKDLNSFSFTDGNGEWIDEDSYMTLSYVDPSALSDIRYNSAEKKARSNNHTYIVFNSDSSFTLTGGKGETLTYKKHAFSGNFPITDVNYLEKRVKLKTRHFDAFKITPLCKKIDIQIYDDDNYKGVKGKNIRSIDLNLSGDTKIYGSAYTFKAYSSVDDMLDQVESGLASISAKANGKVTIRGGKEQVEAMSSDNISHVRTMVYQGTKIAGGKIKGKRSKVCVNAVEDLSNRDLTESGKIFFGKDAYVFRGNPVKPKVTVFAGEKGLKKGRDYKVSYSNNKKPGTGTVTVTGIGEYRGELSATFVIVSKKADLL